MIVSNFAEKVVIFQPYPRTKIVCDISKIGGILGPRNKKKYSDFQKYDNM